VEFLVKIEKLNLLGEKQLKKLIYSKINFDSTGIDENTTVELIFKIDKKER
jgi:hypothetical protein